MDRGNGTKDINHKEDEEEEEETGAVGSTFFKLVLEGLISDEGWSTHGVNKEEGRGD